MKKFSKLIISLLGLACIGLTACGGGQKESNVPVTSIALDTYEIVLLKDETKQINVEFTPKGSKGTIEWTTSDSAVATVKDGLVTAIGEGNADITATVKGTQIFDKCAVSVAADFHDYVKDGSVKLSLDYKGKTFYEDGLEQVTLLTPIDGDTAHFNTQTETLKARFWGIDTPESTGKVQPWGVPASKFTKTKLRNADANGTIVVSSPMEEYGKPTPDSTGSRYMSLVWINETVKNAPFDQLYLLNLWVVQEGLSMKKNPTDIPEYTESFNKAEAQAKVYKLKMWSNEKDPEFNYDGDYQDVSLLDVKREVEKSILDKSHQNEFDNVKIRFTGVVSSYNSGTLYVQEFYPVDDDHPDQGEWAGINIFCGMSTISAHFTTPNTYVQVYGLCKDSEEFGFQVTDTQGHWNVYGDDPTDCKILLSAYENTEEHSLYTFHYSVTEMNKVAKDNNFECLFCSVAVTGTLTCNYFYISDKRAITLGFEETNWNVYIPFMFHGDKSTSTSSKIRWEKEEDFMGRKFTVEAGTYVWHRTNSGNVKYQIMPVDDDSFVWVRD